MDRLIKQNQQKRRYIFPTLFLLSSCLTSYLHVSLCYRIFNNSYYSCGSSYAKKNLELTNGHEDDKKITLSARVSFSDDVAHGRFHESTRFGDEGNTKLRRDLINDKESEYAASIGAAAFAIYSLEETRAEFERRMVESFREDPSTKTDTRTTYNGKENPPDQFQDFGRLPRRSSGVESNVVGGGPMLRSSTRPIEISGPRQRGDARTTGTSKADVWEQARLAKINKWYEKMKAKMKEWENEKKKRAGFEMEPRKAEIERLKRINLSNYQNKVDQIENIAGGARIQLRKSEETIAKHKARKIKTGR